jgi:acetyl-CoA C-acetyltransferase
MGEAWIIDAVRTPRAIGKIGKGAYAHLHPQRLLASPLQALRERNSLVTADVDDVIVGCATPALAQGNDIARMAVLDAGWDSKAAGITVSRFCGSGISAVQMAAASIMAGMEDVVVAGGIEMMSYVASLGAPQPIDSGNRHLRELQPQPHQGISADLVATLEGATRDELDRLAVESQRRAAAAIDAGYFRRSLSPVLDEHGGVVLDEEQYPRRGTTLAALSKLEPAFAKSMDAPIDGTGTTNRQLLARAYPGLEIDHVHHAGNSSGVVDGAAVMLLCSPAYARKHGWKPRARVRAMANVAGDPVQMLNEPGPAARKVLRKAGMQTGDIDLYEVNEAFAVVTWKFMRDLNIDPAICNVNGGAIALGHPIGATGCMLIGTVLDELERRGLGTGLATMCAAGGMAPAIIVERM